MAQFVEEVDARDALNGAAGVQPPGEGDQRSPVQHRQVGVLVDAAELGVLAPADVVVDVRGDDEPVLARAGPAGDEGCGAVQRAGGDRHAAEEALRGSDHGAGRGG